MKVGIIGGGATGLVAAYLLARQGHVVTVFEAAAQPGGLLSTFEVSPEVRLEYFYHHFFTHDAEINWLLAELGIADHVAFLPTTMGMYRGGRIYNFNGVRDLLKFEAIPWSARIRFAFSSAMLVYLPGYAEAENTSCLEWFQRWAGKAATDAIWRPMLEVKFGQAAGRIPLAWMAGRLRQRARSRTGTQEQLGYLRGSLQVLVDRLMEKLRSIGVKVHLGSKTDRLVTDLQGAVTGIEVASETIHLDTVLATIPTPLLASLVKSSSPSYAEQLERIRYMGAICTILAFPKQISPVYWLNVADPGFDFGGVIEQTNLVPPEVYGGRHLLYLSRYVEWNHPLWTMSDDDLLNRQLSQLSKIAGADLSPSLQQHWIFRGKYAAPIAEIGFRDLIPKLQSPLKNLYVASMPHVYPDERSVNNSIRVAAEVVREMGVDTSVVPRRMSLAAKYGH